MTKTVKEHLGEADQIKSHVDEANKLVGKLRDELDRARDAFEWLRKFKTPAFATQDVSYKQYGDFKDTKAVSMGDMLETRITKINALLGDRA